jgi:glycine/D-amino acid oxidase-like deaminating enzyme
MIDIEFLIVGNGLAGTLLAFEMLDRGLDFKILVAEDKSKASLVAAGIFNPLVFKRMTKSWMADELLPVMKKRYVELEGRLNVSFFVEKNILKPLSNQEMHLWKERKLNGEFKKYIHSVESERIYDLLKETAGYGIVTHSGYMKLPVFLNAAENYFRKKRLIVDGSFPFHKYNPENIFVEIGSFKFHNIIFCEGYHVTRNHFFNFLPLKPVKGELLEIYAPELPEDFILNKRVFVLPIGNQIFKVGSTYEWDDLTEKPTSDGKESIIKRLAELITTNYKVVNHVAGIRPTVSDRRPVLGFHPRWNHLSVFNGLGTKGVMLAPYFANEMIQLLINKKSGINQEVQLERFI